MMIVRIYFDGSTTPSVESPLGPLFGIHHGTGEVWGNEKDGYGADNSLFKISENGAYSLIAPMPFASRCRITIKDENSKTLKTPMRVWAQVSYYQYNPNCKLKEKMRFNAIFRKENRLDKYGSESDGLSYKRSYHIGHAQGSGNLLGFTFGLTGTDARDSVSL
jgi:hypothetical protein